MALLTETQTIVDAFVLKLQNRIKDNLLKNDVFFSRGRHTNNRIYWRRTGQSKDMITLIDAIQNTQNAWTDVESLKVVHLTSASLRLENITYTRTQTDQNSVTY